ncbi:hypothetical protein H0H87_012186 [Tephrocybe sp. NHM501043]|nr:hypothetical protein H0H87_012186 [Tephrocybe sp. NHM501043]
MTCSALAKISHTELAENKANGLRLVSLENGVDPVWKTEAEKLNLVHNKINFSLIDRPPTHQKEVKAIIANISRPNIELYVDTLTKFYNRYLTEKVVSMRLTGLSRLLRMCVRTSQIISKYPSSGATVRAFPHSWDQPAVIVKIPGTIDGNLTIVGAHLDTFNAENLIGRAPGAGDGATGCASLLEAFRVMLASGLRSSRAVEFHCTRAISLATLDQWK